MPDWPTHLIVPLLALLIVSKREHQKYIFLLLPLAVIPDFDTFVTQHRALLHNMLIPLLLLLLGYAIKEKRTLFIIASAYIASHVVLDMFGGGVVLFYPVYSRMAFVNASIKMSQTNQLFWKFDYGFKEYGTGWETAYGYISDSIGTGAMVFVLMAGICIAYRNWRG
jgi:membrane-bound metal-dependent hydrolase YbcI (DUF457 family)